MTCARLNPVFRENVVRLLDKLHIAQTKSRAHHCGGNGLLEQSLLVGNRSGIAAAIDEISEIHTGNRDLAR